MNIMERSRRTRLVGVIIALATVLVVVIALLSLVHGGGIYVVVSSAHITNTVGVTLTVDGNVKDTVNLAPGYQVTWHGTVTWFGGGTCTVHEVQAVSVGGAFGPTSDSATPTVCQGGTVEVDLTV